MHQRVPSRNISQNTANILWAKSAGRCEFRGCNRLLWKSQVTQEIVNIAERAHIYAFSSGGPRHDTRIPKKDLNNLDNLLLVCHACHKTIDKDKTGLKYSADLLLAWKTEHEHRIETNTGVSPHRKSHILLYGAKIGSIDIPPLFNSAAMAMFPKWCPASDKPILIPSMRSWPCDHEAAFWTAEDNHLIKAFNTRILQPVQDGDIHHLSVFALAPQPLLIRLGSLLTDLIEADVHPRSREPQGWEWRRHPGNFRFLVQPPDRPHGTPVLVLALSDHVRKDRITTILGSDLAIWTITIPNPNNDFLRSEKQMQAFRETCRQVMVEVAKTSGNRTLNIFPVAPAALAVELGRIRQPKASMPWQIWDQVNHSGGFIPAILIQK